jgi:uroporphyrin-III C-methyltransferase / precorrin-2 dehydrogenase / sirohydrochlorin ferrochelatase
VTVSTALAPRDGAPVDRSERELFPVFLKLTGRRVIVVGAGPVAASKIQGLLDAGADVTVVAPDIHPDIARAPVTLIRRPFEASDLEGAWLAVAAATPAVNREVAQTAEARGLFVNAVDDPPNATAYLGGIVRRGGVTFAISTNGRAPALAGLLREALDAVIPADLQRWTTEAVAIRRSWLAEGVPMAERRPLLLDALLTLYPERGTVPIPGTVPLRGVIWRGARELFDRRLLARYATEVWL